MGLTLPLRPCNDAFDLTDVSGDRLVSFIRSTLPSSKVFLFMGLPKTGKTTFMNAYEVVDSHRTIGRWDRRNIFDMVGGYDEKFLKHIDGFELSLLNDFLVKEWSILCYEAIARRVTDRRRILKLANHYQATAIVFDGPPELISERLRKAILSGERWGITADEADSWILDQWFSSVWPTFEEGWHSIYYVNTFGLAGKKWLSMTTRRV